MIHEAAMLTPHWLPLVARCEERERGLPCLDAHAALCGPELPGHVVRHVSIEPHLNLTIRGSPARLVTVRTDGCIDDVRATLL